MKNSAGNMQIWWDDHYLYAVARILLKPLAQKIDPEYKFFDSWWGAITGGRSKKEELGGRAILRNKYRGQIDEKVKVVSREHYNFNE